MFSNLSYKTKQFFFVLIKLSIVVGAFYFIYCKLTENGQLQPSDFIAFLKENNIFSAKNIVFLVILSGFNWFFEILKWKTLVKTIKTISFKEALEQSLGGLTASLITPNRIGDYGAKAAYFTKTYRKRVLLLNLLGNIGQMTITTIFGVTGLVIFINRYQLEFDYYKVTRFGALILLISVFAIFGIKHKCFNIRGYSFNQIIDYIKNITLKVHVSNIILSLLRYIIFSFQFYYLLTIFEVNLSYYDNMVVITSTYLLASIIPTISIFDVVIKGSVAVFLFTHIGVDELTILCIVLIMWILNFAIPSVLGSYFVLNFKLPKTKA
ncbi:hypothetical protein BWZ20_07160 [Winogradskyella sp. J14-2]|uniref:lysylphosphatidylglycerol synthase domain-containing protein n=1 Tax=Winogradskyella sp. J14-2 TaxID=1936080 RepID=UPI000972BFD7|nr:lysylphosphatidylglycerol synthase domain-containing protein [Winogradskyella sp. J14-2]APY08090.1 hypothetical protein BWZ20_07160 [Winogradskyella sp. J14-2]